MLHVLSALRQFVHLRENHVGPPELRLLLWPQAGVGGEVDHELPARAHRLGQGVYLLDGGDRALLGGLLARPLDPAGVPADQLVIGRSLHDGAQQPVRLRDGGRALPGTAVASQCLQPLGTPGPHARRRDLVQVHEAKVGRRCNRSSRRYSSSVVAARSRSSTHCSSYSSKLTAPASGLVQSPRVRSASIWESQIKGVHALTTVPAVELSVAAPRTEFHALTPLLRRIGSHVRYLGWLRRPQLWKAFADHDALVTPSTTLEAMGLVALEAQACGLPVLYQPVPGLNEALAATGMATDFTTPAALARDLDRLRKTPGLLPALQAVGRTNAARYPLSTTAAALTELGQQIA
ncbi:glycosyltransferase [Streptomyces buecherae]|uniref:Glycosyltransferase n=1 Tax=Streptomyces buecherae TaxID=2763006 RepID=A0A7H8NA41_9ACTN|nr:glycosyltransferase [Streptomyces buecherae]